jgi:uncharacterized membrane protein YfcA
MIIAISFTGLTILMVYFLSYYLRDLFKNRHILAVKTIIASAVVGFITDFLDTLGIGSFAITTILLKATKLLKIDRELPGTLNAGHTIPAMMEAYIFITVVKVSPLTLFTLVPAAIIGSWVGSKLVTKFPEQRVQFIMGLALIITAVLMTLRQLNILTMLGEGNTAMGLTGIALVVGIVLNFIFGILMTMGVGLFAPCMAMLYILGLNPLAAFPIMMGSCAGLMPVASVEFVKAKDYTRPIALGITLGGIIGVIIAAFFVTSLNLEVLTWLVIVVVIYTGIMYTIKGLRREVKMA